MIGQFGVGFYSAFLVSDLVEVRSKSNDGKQFVWTSTASGEFHIYDDSENEHQLKRGTEIVLHLKDGQTEYLEENKIKEIVHKHSEFVGPQILLWTSKEVEKEVSDDEDEKKEDEKKDSDKKKDEDSDEKKEDKSDEVAVKDVSDAPEPKKEKKKVTEIVEEFTRVNSTKPLWAMKPEDIKKEEYTAFYKSISNDWEEPLAYKHFHVEGQVEFTVILFVPKRMPFDLFNNNKDPSNIKLFVRRVLINEQAKELCPEYLSFIKGVVDSEEMPLNISRETLQKNTIMKVIRNNIAKKAIELFFEISEDKELFKTFYKNFSKNIKYGIHEDSTNRKKLADLIRFNSTSSGKEQRSLKDYVESMPEHQKDIYYITGDSQESLENMPFLEVLKKKKLEVLFMTDPIDEYFVQQMSEYEGHKLVSVTKEGLELPQTDEEKKKHEEVKKEFEPFCKRVKEILGARVEKVEVSNRMTESPCYISTGKFGWSSRMEQIMKNQALRDTTFSSHMAAKKILEINPHHAVVEEMARRLKENVNDAMAKDLVWLIYETAVLTSGGLSLENPVEYAGRIYKLTRLGLGIVNEKDAGEDLPDLEPADGEKENEATAEMEDVD